jgi:hypothetical protein
MKVKPISILLLTCILFLLACASGFQGWQTIYERTFEKTPYYFGKGIQVEGTIACFPFHFYEIPTFSGPDAALSDAMGILLDHMENALGVMDYPVSVSYMDLLVTNGAPTASLGFKEEDSGDDANPSLTMQIIVHGGTKEWRAALANYSHENNIDYFVLPFLNITGFPIKSGFFKKEIRMGTEYAIPVKWYVSVDEPVSVLNITGVVIDGEGNFLKAGGEGLYAEVPGSFWENIFLGASSITEEGVSKAMEQRREDLNNQPLVWEEGLRNLMKQLLD